jgi:catechol 2,3-dioxygenase-like lactoylglutathione lyase family enzyme
VKPVAGGNATIFIADMEVAVRFYTEVLGMELTSRYDNHWATVSAGGFTIGLHPASEKHPAPGTRGATVVGLDLAEPIEAAAERLLALGVPGVGEILRGDGGNFLYFHDPDGNELYFWEHKQS